MREVTVGQIPSPEYDLHVTPVGPKATCEVGMGWGCYRTIKHTGFCTQELQRGRHKAPKNSVIIFKVKLHPLCCTESDSCILLFVRIKWRDLTNAS